MSQSSRAEKQINFTSNNQLSDKFEPSSFNVPNSSRVIIADGNEGDVNINLANDANDQIPPYMQHMTTILVILHVSVFITGLVGNSLVCLSVYRNKSLRTVTNYYIVNLAVADFLVILICLPPTVYWDLNLTWDFGLILCKLVLYLQSISVSVSVLTLTCISIDRWYAICRPLEFSSTKYRAKVTIALIWMASLMFASPDVIFLKTNRLFEENGQEYFDCAHSWPDESTKIYQLCIVTFLFVCPFVLMSISYWHIVNVLWRNETITDSLQRSFQLEEEESVMRRRFASSASANIPIGATCAINALKPEEVSQGGKEAPTDSYININQAGDGSGKKTANGGEHAALADQGELDGRLVVLSSVCQTTRRLASNSQCLTPNALSSSSSGSSARQAVSLQASSPSARNHNQFAKLRPKQEHSSTLNVERPDMGAIIFISPDKRKDSVSKADTENESVDKKSQPIASTLVSQQNAKMSNSAPMAPSKQSSCCYRLMLRPRKHETSGRECDINTSKKYRKNLANYAAQRDKFRKQLSDSGARTRKAATSSTSILAQPLNEVTLTLSPCDTEQASSSWSQRQKQQQLGENEANQLQVNSSNLQQLSVSSSETRFCKLIESRKKAAKMLIVIVIMFGLCYLPVHFLNILRYTIGLPQNNLTQIASLVSHWLCYFNSAVNPLIYNLMSGKFRHEFANLFFCKCFRRQTATQLSVN